jgi:uncharacterized membrane protein
MTKREPTNNPKTMKDSLRHRAFRVAVVVKMLDGVIEAAGGLWLYFYGNANLPRLLSTLFRPELLEDPHDFIATHVLAFVNALPVSMLTFIALYLTIRGLTKTGLMIALSKNQYWAYPVSLLLLTALVLYGVYRLILDFSYTIGFFLLIDSAVIGLIYAEYREVRSTSKPH